MSIQRYVGGMHVSDVTNLPHSQSHTHTQKSFPISKGCRSPLGSQEIYHSNEAY